MRYRIPVAILIGLAAGLLCTAYQVRDGRGAGDLTWPLCAGRALLSGRDPYADCRLTYADRRPAPPDPLTTALVTLPLTPLSDPLAAGIFFGIFTALLAIGLTRDGWAGLLLLLSLPYVASLQVVQWRPLFLAAWYLPGCAALAPVKPQSGLALLIARPDRKVWLAAASLVLVSLLIMPDWPWRWLSQARTYDGLWPALICPPLLLAALHWRDERGRLLLALALLPARLWYDQLLPAALFDTTTARLAFVGLSWLVYLGWWRWPSPLWAALLYGAALIALLHDHRDDPRPRNSDRRGIDQDFHDNL